MKHIGSTGSSPLFPFSDPIDLKRVMDRGLTCIRPEIISAASREGDHSEDVLEFILAEPYATVTGYFLEKRVEAVVPVDSESGPFLSGLAFSNRAGHDELLELVGRYGAVIPEHGKIVTGGRENTGPPYTLFSIACFSLFVKFFHTILNRKKNGIMSVRDLDFLDRVRSYEHKYIPGRIREIDDPGKDWYSAIDSAGKAIVSGKLVDSIFGNLSFRNGDDVYITGSGSYLDDLRGQIVKVPLEGPIGSGSRPSSEVEVHRNIYKATGNRTVVHGHPLFTVILSLDLETEHVPGKIGDIPVVSGGGEDDSPPPAISVPRSIKSAGSVIVQGHGIFCTGSDEFNEPVQRMADIENDCREEYFRKLF